MLDREDLDARAVAARAMAIAAGICVWTNESVTVETIETGEASS